MLHRGLSDRAVVGCCCCSDLRLQERPRGLAPSVPGPVPPRCRGAPCRPLPCPAPRPSHRHRGAQGCKPGSRRVMAAMQPPPSPIALEHRLQRGERVSAVVATHGAASMEASWPLPSMSWLLPAMSWPSPSQPGFPCHAAVSRSRACGGGEVNGDGGALPRPVFIVVFLLGKKPEGLGGGGKLVGAWEKQLARL